MILSTANQQKLKYSVLNGELPVYQTDDRGNIIYDEIDGQQVPRETGETKLSYSVPEDFLGNIMFSTGWAARKEYGVSITDYDFTLLLPKGYIDLSETSLIWQDSEPTYLDDAQTEVDPTSADYRVTRVAPALTTVKYILSKIDHEKKN